MKILKPEHTLRGIMTQITRIALFVTTAAGLVYFGFMYFASASLSPLLMGGCIAGAVAVYLVITSVLKLSSDEKALSGKSPLLQ